MTVPNSASFGTLNWVCQHELIPTLTALHIAQIGEGISQSLEYNR